MGTRALVARQTDGGLFETFYVPSDGYPSELGKALAKVKGNQVEALFDPIATKDFTTFQSFTALGKYATDSWIEYVYVWDGGWSCVQFKPRGKTGRRDHRPEHERW